MVQMENVYTEILRVDEDRLIRMSINKPTLSIKIKSFYGSIRQKPNKFSSIISLFIYIFY